MQRLHHQLNIKRRNTLCVILKVMGSLCEPGSMVQSPAQCVITVIFGKIITIPFKHRTVVNYRPKHYRSELPVDLLRAGGQRTVTEALILDTKIAELDWHNHTLYHASPPTEARYPTGAAEEIIQRDPRKYLFATHSFCANIEREPTVKTMMFP